MRILKCSAFQKLKWGEELLKPPAFNILVKSLARSFCSLIPNQLVYSPIPISLILAISQTREAPLNFKLYNNVNAKFGRGRRGRRNSKLAERTRGEETPGNNAELDGKFNRLEQWAGRGARGA